MSGFLYYIPEQQAQVTLEQLKAGGLEYAFETLPTASGVQGGPDGGSGVILAQEPFTPAHRIRYLPEQQTWRKLPRIEACETCEGREPCKTRELCETCQPWVGMYRDDPPGPQDLARREMLDGYLLELGDGRQWQIPVAREVCEKDGRFVSESALPRRMELSQAGEFVPGDPLPQFASLSAAAAEYYDAFDRALKEDGGKIRFEFDDQAAVTVLAANYRISRLEVVMLGLLTYGGPYAVRILSLAIDLPGLAELQKKTDSAGSASGDGPSEGIPTTGQP